MVKCPGCGALWRIKCAVPKTLLMGLQTRDATQAVLVQNTLTASIRSYALTSPACPSNIAYSAGILKHRLMGKLVDAYE
jgi:hypothetical protein